MRPSIERYLTIDALLLAIGCSLDTDLEKGVLVNISVCMIPSKVHIK